jgi:CD2 antigen cytoplasmic tail-binding protein 2
MASNLSNLYTTELTEENKRKTRFDPLHPEFIRQEVEEGDEFEEDIGISRSGTKRKNVRTDVSYPSISLSQIANMCQGYDSDSSQEGDSKKSKKPKKTNDDDDDMFDEEAPAGEENKDDELDAYGKLKRKKVNFVSYKTFQGQELSDDEPDVEDELESIPSTPGASDDEEIIDEEVGLAGSRKHAPKIEKFNLRQEQAEGVFTEDGTFVRKAADPRAHQDAWMQGLTKGAIQRAAVAMEKQRQRELELQQREKENNRLTPTERLERLIRILNPSETPLEALARLNGKKKKWQPSQKWKKSKMVIDTQDRTAEEEADRVKEHIEAITAYADSLLTLGNQDIYSTRREKLVMLYQENTGERFREDPQFVQEPEEPGKWEYKWPGTDEVHSGFGSENMKSWKAGGFFGEGVLCRREGSLDAWKNSEDITF